MLLETFLLLVFEAKYEFRGNGKPMPRTPRKNSANW